MSSSCSVQSPTISSVSDSASPSSHRSDSVRKRKSSDRIMEELESAQKRILELEDIIRLKDERIKLLEEEHERHLLHQAILASPEIERPRRGRKSKIKGKKQKIESKFESKPEPTVRP